MDLRAIYTKKPIIFLLLILAVIGFFVYFFNLNNQLFWDDDDWIINNNFVHQINWDNIKFWFTHDVLAGIGLTSNYYRPFLFFTFAFNYIISGIKPLGYHLFSNLIHIANGILVFLLLNKLLTTSDVRWTSDVKTFGRWVAFLTSLIFLIHPLQTEAVTYISGRGDLLVAFFMLLSLLLFFKAESRDLGWASRGKVLSLVSLAFGLLSRETAIIFPFLALSLFVSFISKERFLKSIKRGLIKTWPYFTVVLVYGILRLTSLNFLNTLNFYEQPNLYSDNLHIRFFTFLPILFSYIKLLLVPIGLHMEREAVVYTSLLQWPVWLVSFGLVGLLYWLRHLYKNQSTAFHFWLFGSAWFFIALGPVSGVTPINALMYEHWLYLPMISFWLIVSFYLVKFFGFLKSRKLSTFYFLLSTFLIAYLSFFGFQAIKRNILWGNPIKFYENILEYEPGSIRINNNLGNLYFDMKDIEKAEYYYRKATEENNIFSQPYYNLGAILQSKGDIHGAIQLYEKAIEINPSFFYPYQNLAVIYAQQGNLLKAADNIEKLKTLIPNNPRVYYNSALVYIALNDKKKALEDINIGLKYSHLDPETGKLLEELARELSK